MCSTSLNDSAAKSLLIYVCRHGQTDYNLEGRIQGNMDIKLNDQGRTESRALAEYLAPIPFKEAYSSHLSRASETAEICLREHEGLELTKDPGLRERSLGSLEGHVWTPDKGMPADAETGAEFRQRVAVWVRGFLAAHAPAYAPPAPAAQATLANGTGAGAPEEKTEEEKILVISHGAYISALYAVLVTQFGFRSRNAKQTAGCANTCIMRVRVDYDGDGRYAGEILGWNETPHLGRVRGTKDTVDDDVRTAWRRAVSGADENGAAEGAAEVAEGQGR